jgi:gentisate 1,2-dioxygenase
MSNTSNDFVNYTQFLSRSTQPRVRANIWRWPDIAHHLDKIAATDVTEPGNPTLALVNGSVGDQVSVVPSLNGMVQILEPGFQGEGHRHSNYAIFIVKEGHGHSVVDDVSFEWNVGDVFVAPAWSHHLHCNDSTTQRAVLYTFQNVPEVVNAGIWFYMGKEEGKLVHN